MAEHEATPVQGELVSFIPKTPAEASKAIGHVAVVLISAVIAASSSGVSLTEWISIAILALGLIPIWFVSGTFVKVGVAGGLAALQVIATLVTNWGDFGHITGTDWLLVVLAVLNAIGVGVIPNAPYSGPQKLAPVGADGVASVTTVK